MDFTVGQMALPTGKTLGLGMGWTTEAETNPKLVKLGKDRMGRSVLYPFSEDNRLRLSGKIAALDRTARNPQFSPLPDSLPSLGLAGVCLGKHILCRMGPVSLS